MKAPVLHTPDGRYIVVRGRLWRASNPNLSPAAHDRLVADLMNARRAVRDAGDSDIEISKARKSDLARGEPSGGQTVRRT